MIYNLFEMRFRKPKGLSVYVLRSNNKISRQLKNMKNF